MEYRKYPERMIRHWLAAPIVWSMLIPILFLDLYLTIFNSIVLRLYKIQPIIRKEYIRIDRHKLNFLPWYEKLFCAYCGYANGLFAYAVKIAAVTEKYWCGIRHRKYNNFREPSHHREFIEYGKIPTSHHKFRE
jgi:hypothetical protein